MPNRELYWAAKLSAMLIKDLRVELRTRYALNALIMFALVTLFTLAITFTGQTLSKGIHAALIWVMIYFAGLQGLSGGFVKEEEARTAMALRLYAPSGIIFFGKLLQSLIILAVLVMFLIPLYYILLNPPIEKAGSLLLVLGLGVVGLSATSTISAAMVSKANVKGALFAVLSFPLMLPLLLVAISATSICLGGGDTLKFWDSLKILIGYPVIITAVSFLLFEYVWNN